MGKTVTRHHTVTMELRDDDITSWGGRRFGKRQKKREGHRSRKKERILVCLYLLFTFQTDRYRVRETDRETDTDREKDNESK